MRILDEEGFSWLLYEEGDRLFLVVVCGTIGLSCVNIELNEAEKRKYAQKGGAFISKLSRSVSRKSSEFMDRHIPDFDKWPGHDQALDKWRARSLIRPRP